MRLADGGLFVWSPIALTADLKAAVDALGPVRFLVSPNLLHHLFLGEWKAAYPQARLYASPGLRKRRKDLAFDGDLGDAPDPAWAADIDQVAVRGSPWITEVVFFHRASGTAIFTDLIENFPPDWFRGWKSFVARLDGIVQPHPGRAARTALELPVSPGRGTQLPRTHPRLANRTRDHCPRRCGDGRRRRLRAQGVRLAAIGPCQVRASGAVGASVLAREGQVSCPSCPVIPAFCHAAERWFPAGLARFPYIVLIQCLRLSSTRRISHRSSVTTLTRMRPCLNCFLPTEQWSLGR